MSGASSREESPSSEFPRWQPDEEADECFNCHKRFSMLFRRHHCRKCGRVVCSGCSPHRITIPRQFIVNPPDIIDQPAINEPVRLCNPCVPDPQPDPGISPSYSGPVAMSPRDDSLHSRQPSSTQPSRRVDRPHSVATFDEILGMDNPTPPLSEASRRIRARSMAGTSFAHNPLPPLPSPLNHSRYSGSMDSRPLPSFHGPHSSRRPRNNSSLLYAQQIRDLQGMGSPPSLPPPRQPRPRLNEDDICPVCFRALPPRGANNDETDREAHIVECITSRSPSSRGNTPTTNPGNHPSRSSGEASSSSSRPTMLRILPFTATEKDCVANPEDGNSPECSICMVEYDPGDELARLECFCKFHRECIVSWLNRKAECPVHKAARWDP